MLINYFSLKMKVFAYLFCGYKINTYLCNVKLRKRLLDKVFTFRFGFICKPTKSETRKQIRDNNRN